MTIIKTDFGSINNKKVYLFTIKNSTGTEIQVTNYGCIITSIKVKDKIDAEYLQDRVSAISDEEMFQWVREVFGDELPPLK